MCVVSNIGGYARDTWPQKYPWIDGTYPSVPAAPFPHVQPYVAPSVSKMEMDALRKEVRELKKLLKAAKLFDEATGQKDCEHPEKIAFLKAVAALVKVDLSEVLEG